MFDTFHVKYPAQVTRNAPHAANKAYRCRSKRQTCKQHEEDGEDAVLHPTLSGLKEGTGNSRARDDVAGAELDPVMVEDAKKKRIVTSLGRRACAARCPGVVHGEQVRK